MKTELKSGLAAAALLTVLAGATGPAFAATGMCDTKPMSSDTMKSDGMADDTMASGDAMMGTYTVKRGDSLWKIAAATLCDGDRYPEIVAANTDMLGGSMMIHPGQMLHIPGD